MLIIHFCQKIFGVWMLTFLCVCKQNSMSKTLNTSNKTVEKAAIGSKNINFDRGVSPADIVKPEFYILFTILNMNYVFCLITIINYSL